MYHIVNAKRMIKFRLKKEEADVEEVIITNY